MAGEYHEGRLAPKERKAPAGKNRLFRHMRSGESEKNWGQADFGLSVKVSEQLWLASGPRRLMVWGRFDRHIAAIIPAKELRARIRQRGVAGTSDQYKADILRSFIEQWIAETDHRLD